MSRILYAIALAGLAGCLSTAPTRQLSQPPAPVVAEADAIEEPDEVPPESIDPEALDPEAIGDDAPLNDGGEDYDPDAPPEGDELPPAVRAEPHPFAEVSDEQLEEMLVSDPASLGPLSIGRPSGGALRNGVQMESSDRWHVVNPAETWGTPETIAALSRCIDKVHEQFPDTPVLPIGDISDHDGGHLTPHVSHQSGRDVDVGFYYVGEERWYTRAHANNLDLPRTWAFVRAMVTETDVERIFIDRRIQPLIKEYALSIGESPEWLDGIFGGPLSNLRPLVLHEPGHDTHIHVRFYNPIAQESGRRVYKMLIAHKMIKPPTYYVSYKVRSGDTLIKIARKFRTNVKTLKKANRLRSNRIFAGRTYKIPRRGGVTPPPELILPERRLAPPLGEPPQATVQASQTLTTDPAASGTAGGATAEDHGAAASAQ